MHLRQPGFMYSTCRPFTKNKERIQKFKEPGDSQYNYQNELDKACFQHVMAYKDFKDLSRRTASDRVLCEKAFNITKNPKYDGCQRGLPAMVCNFFDKKSSTTYKGTGINSDLVSEIQRPSELARIAKVSDRARQLVEELHKSIIRKFENVKCTHLSKIIFLYHLFCSKGVF